MVPMLRSRSDPHRLIGLSGPPPYRPSPAGEVPPTNACLLDASDRGSDRVDAGRDARRYERDDGVPAVVVSTRLSGRARSSPPTRWVRGRALTGWSAAAVGTTTRGAADPPTGTNSIRMMRTTASGSVP